ncbi:MAG: murein L,D-transpeptidase family protein [Hyphomicrobiaceae bacterium]
MTRIFRHRLILRVLLALAIVPPALGLLVAGPGAFGAIGKFEVSLRRTEHLLRWRLGLPIRGMPALGRLDERLAEKGLARGAPVLVRLFKEESALEIWMKSKDGRFTLFTTYPICRWSGDVGPKLAEGDHQSPEGFYTVSRSQLNPRSRWHRSFNLGFPNRFDRAHGRTGTFIMVHGGCSSVGCFAVTNEAVDEIWQLVTAALKGGQKRFQVQSFPFRLSEWNLALHADSRWADFWRELKVGHDLFEANRLPPRVSVCAGHYVASAGAEGSDGSEPIEESCSTRQAVGPEG